VGAAPPTMSQLKPPTATHWKEIIHLLTLLLSSLCTWEGEEDSDADPDRLKHKQDPNKSI
jgi:hypothetical protein